jgi:hypothetical protein
MAGTGYVYFDDLTIRTRETRARGYVAFVILMLKSVAVILA